MIGDILIKLVLGNALTLREIEELRLLNFVKISEPVPITSLSQLNEDLGHVRAGAFIAGTGDPWGSDFTGMGLFHPPLTIGGGSYNLVGANAGTLQAGISATDGEFYAGAGNVIVNSDGITLSLPLLAARTIKTAIKWANGTASPASIDAYYSSATNDTYNLSIANQAPALTLDIAQIAISTDNATSDAPATITLKSESSPKVAQINLSADYIALTGELLMTAQTAPATPAAGTSAVWISSGTNKLASINSGGNRSDYYETSGWLYDVNTWTYASASTFTIAGDHSAKFHKGMRLRWKQGGAYKYGVVASATYGAPNTTVTIVVNTDYTVANAAITDNFYSSLAEPPNWPGWFNYTPTFTGFSADPTVSYSCYNLSGMTCHIIHNISANGTSNATTYTVSLPVAANGSSRHALPHVVDNGVVGATGVLTIANAATTASLFKSAGAVWTNPGAKGAAFSIFYQW